MYICGKIFKYNYEEITVYFVFPDFNGGDVLATESPNGEFILFVAKLIMENEVTTNQETYFDGFYLIERSIVDTKNETLLEKFAKQRSMGNYRGTYFYTQEKKIWI